MIKTFKNISVKKILTFVIGILVAIGAVQQSDIFTKVLEEVETIIPEDVIVGDFLKDEDTTTATTSRNGPYLVTKIADGDTITVDIDGTLERVRLLGIDAAETSNTDAVASECYAEEAKQALISLLETATYVYLEYDESQELRDKYDRLLAYVYIKNSETEGFIFVNNYLLQEGFVYEYTYNKPYLYQKEFQDAEVTAYEEERGLWGVCK